ncbi:ABC transporter ATP-binding protein [Phytoactinopolyspora endophytica]|uniref:ABC transporter ATP-binding protein n=1 Tax=Phytoactinopolyspora endophytica TaxID=1642495 RepID=UPI0013ECCF89|nr:ABC transporter ATP-binding protein [Phytoactinopolyspora endophytica]
MRPVQASDALLEIDGLTTHFFTREGTVRAVDGVSLTVPAGKTVCVVGESGCGKSVTARSVLGLVDEPGRVVAGEIWWRRDGQAPVDLARYGPKSEEMRRVRGGEISMVFQEPMASLSPMYTVGAQLVEAIRLHMPLDREQARERAADLLRRVGIPRPEERLDAYSFQLSGGMCQRVMIAIALAAGPALLIADEPTTALDVTTQARIIDLIHELQAETGMSVLFITHDLGVVAEIADEVVVMYLGTVVERGGVDEIFHDPKHPYTRALLGSIPRMGAGTGQRLATIRGNVPHPSDRPSGCPFHPRCGDAVAGLCDRSDPPDVRVGPGRTARCVLHENADLIGDDGQLGAEEVQR